MDPTLESLSAEQSTLLGERFAGATWEADGTLVFGIVEGIQPPGVLRNHPNIRVVTRKFSSARLSRTMDIVAERLNPILAPGQQPGTAGVWPWEAEVNTKANIVDIKVGRDHETKKTLVEGALADEIRAGTVRISYGDVEYVQPACSRTNCTYPFRGGTETTGQGQCTLGFAMKDWAGIREQTTAGHCPGAFPYPYFHFHAEMRIGNDLWTTQPKQYGPHPGVDLKIMSQTNEGQPAPTNIVYRAANGATRITLKNTNQSEPQNYRACFEGVNSGERCGTIGATNTSVDGVSGYGRLDTDYGCKGDSGGPVIHQDVSRAYGMVSHINVPRGYDCVTGAGAVRVYFTWVPRMEAASGHQLLLTTTTETLGPGQRMVTNDRIRSVDGRYELIMQGDGNLVLYQLSPWVPLWASNTVGQTGAYLTMQNDGNLVIYRNGTPIWSRGCCVAGTRLVIQNDANLVMYRPNGGVSWARTWG